MSSETMLAFMLLLCAIFRFIFAAGLCTLFAAFLLALVNQLCKTCGFSLRRRYHLFSLERLWPLKPAYRMYRHAVCACCRYCTQLMLFVRSLQSDSLHDCAHTASHRRKRSRLAHLPVAEDSDCVPRATADVPVSSLSSSSSFSSSSSSSPLRLQLDSVLFHHAAAAAEGSRLARPPRPPKHLLPQLKHTHRPHCPRPHATPPGPPATSPATL
ncbi:protein O22 [Cercopithecine betaherpesvirus 5]|uniref:Protein O22 n=1 Tax=Simian cytomegalovirus (strain Colburn) TaxID=50292 RepID=G8XTK7_SCMVC|nr:protein O22 [Cercopithecine betaherpesvirus 5]AEV80499.1 protein O22 [Cercopithecine betaherpesvirus 5]